MRKEAKGDIRKMIMTHKQLKKLHCHLNPDKEHVNDVSKNLAHNILLYGAAYCPCQSQHTKDTICPCKFMRDKGACRCGLYIKDSEQHG